MKYYDQNFDDDGLVKTVVTKQAIPPQLPPKKKKKKVNKNIFILLGVLAGVAVLVALTLIFIRPRILKQWEATGTEAGDSKTADEQWVEEYLTGITPDYMKEHYDGSNFTISSISSRSVYSNGTIITVRIEGYFDGYSNQIWKLRFRYSLPTDGDGYKTIQLMEVEHPDGSTDPEIREIWTSQY